MVFLGAFPFTSQPQDPVLSWANPSLEIVRSGSSYGPVVFRIRIHLLTPFAEIRPLPLLRVQNITFVSRLIPRPSLLS